MAILTTCQSLNRFDTDYGLQVFWRIVLISRFTDYSFVGPTHLDEPSIWEKSE